VLDQLFPALAQAEDPALPKLFAQLWLHTLQCSVPDKRITRFRTAALQSWTKRLSSAGLVLALSWLLSSRTRVRTQCWTERFSCPDRVLHQRQPVGTSSGLARDRVHHRCLPEYWQCRTQCCTQSSPSAPLPVLDPAHLQAAAR
jgi:hypothetical protein